MNKSVLLSQEQVLATLAAWNLQIQQASDEVRRKILPPFKGIFIGPLNFQHLIFNEHVNFQGAIFVGDANFYGVQFLQGADFSFAQFSEKAIFTEAEFSTWRTSFINVVFKKAAGFSTTTFLDSVSFGGTRFLGLSTFDTTKFTQGVVFSGAEFVETAYFDQVEFDGISYFKNTECREEAFFYYAQFRGRIYFERTKFRKKVDFHLSVFEGQVYFIGANQDSTVFTPTTEVVFRQAVIKDGVLFFENTDLSRCSFWGTNLQQFHFLSVQWPKLRGRKSIYDESLCCDLQRKKEERPTYAVVETLYRQLRKNYEERGDYGEAGDFYYGEMEMKLRQKSWFGKRFSLTAFYEYVSAYGESYLRALFWISSFFILWVCLYRMVPFQAPKDDLILFQESPLLNLQFLSLPIRQECRSVHPCGFLSWQSAFIYSFEVMTFLSPSYVEPISDLGRLARELQSFIGPLLLALFALAVRRKFHR